MSRRHHHSSDYPGYVDEYERWVNSLSAQERAELKRLGVDRPDLPSDRANTREKDLADTPLASESPEVMADHEKTEEDTEARSDVLAAFCARIRSASNPLLVFDAVCFATGVLALDGQSQTELAKRHGVSRAAFSKIATQWVKTFGIRPSRGMKSAKARKRYSQLTRAKWHERHHNHGRSGEQD